MTDDRGRAADFWDREIEQPTHSSWMAPPAVRHYINQQIAGDPGMWPLEWFRKTIGRRFPRALSVGCGSGALERDLIRLDLCDTIDAFDGSIASIVTARADASKHIRYYVADFNRPALPRQRYDAVFFHQSLHHVAKLEKLLRAVLRALKPDGVLYLDEFIGPSRHEWNERKLEAYQPLYVRFPESARWFDYMPFPVEWNDPSEAVRSGEIVARLKVGFEIREFRGYGGNVLSVLFPALLPERITEAMVEEMIASDRAAIAAGAQHFHAVIVAAPKRGARAGLARMRYFIEPKIRMVLRAIVPRRNPMTRPRRVLH